MKHVFAEQRETSLAVSLSFDEFELGHMAFDHGVVDLPGEPCLNCGFVSFDSSREALQWRQDHCARPAVTRHLIDVLLDDAASAESLLRAERG
jgi:hypothetical protein